MAYTDIDDPKSFFNTVLWTGNGADRTITTDHATDWIWMKDRDQGIFHRLTDSVRGAAKVLFTNETNAEQSDQYGTVGSFTSTGFTIRQGASNSNYVGANENNIKYVGWSWVGGGSASSNSDGSITSSVSASTDAGFSIISYTGVGGTSNTLGHGLGVKPKMFIVKCRSHANEYWGTWIDTDGDGTSNYRLSLNVTDTAYGNDPITFSNSTITLPSSANAQWDGSGRTYIGYCFAEKKGYSKIGSYTGNASANGPVIFTGFKPAFVMIKKATGAANSWCIGDNKRSSFNIVFNYLLADRSDVDESGSGQERDFLSNGFKIRNSNNMLNTSGETYIYIAFAESPFVNSNGVPNNAR